MCLWDRAPAHVCSQCDGLVSGRPQGFGLLGPLGLLKGVASPQLLHSFPLLCIGIRDLTPVDGCKYLYLTQLVAGRASQRTAMLGSCLQVHRCFFFSNGCHPV